MAVAEAHPKVEELVAFILGTLADEKHASIEAHVADCVTCQERAAVAPSDTFVELLRSLHTFSGRGAETVAEAQAQTPERLTAASETVTVPPAMAPARSVEGDGPKMLDALPAELVCHERYRVVRLVGAGGMGAVYQAEHRVMQRLVALKVINRAYTVNAATLERFRREVRAAARLSHPNIVTTHDAEDAGETHFLVMEFVEGVSLDRLVKDHGPLSVAEACTCIRQAALGLQHAHERGMVHRDIKPQNLIRCANGTVKVLDFGLALLTAERGGKLTETNVIMGTPEYMAPEQAEDPRNADVRADVYSLGCTLWFLLTGSVPYPAETPLFAILAHREEPVPSLLQVRPDAPVGLADVLTRMLAKRPADRYAAPGEVATALEPFANPPPPEKSEPMVLASPSESPRGLSRRLVVPVLAALLLAGGAIAGAVVYRIQSDKGELVITTESDDVVVVIKQGGKQVDIVDTKTDKRITLPLRSGVYELELKGAPPGLTLTIDKATLTRGNQTLAKIERVEKKPLEKVGEVRRFEGHTDIVWRAVFSPDERRILTASADGTVRLWEVETGKELRRFRQPGQIFDAAFSPDGRRILAGSGEEGDECVHLWDLDTGEERLFKGHTGPVAGVLFTPDGSQALSSGYDRTIRVWDVKTGTELRRLEGNTAIVQFLSLSPDGRRLLSGSVDNIVRLWDVPTGKEIRSFNRHKGAVRNAVFSADGKRGLSGSFDRTLSLWDLETGREVRRLEGHTWAVLWVAISPDGRYGLSGAGDPDKTIRLWDLDSEKEIYRLDNHTNGVTNVTFSADGRYCLSASYDKTVRLWRLPDPGPAKDKP
jgi:WD40 repeat protein